MGEQVSLCDFGGWSDHSIEPGVPGSPSQLSRSGRQGSLGALIHSGRQDPRPPSPGTSQPSPAPSILQLPLFFLESRPSDLPWMALSHRDKQTSWFQMSQETRTGSVLGFVLCIYFINLFILAVLGLRCCAQVFSSCGEWRLLSSCGVRASHHAGFSCCEAWVIGTWAWVFAALGSTAAAPEHRLSSCGAWA